VYKNIYRKCFYVELYQDLQVRTQGIFCKKMYVHFCSFCAVHFWVKDVLEAGWQPIPYNFLRVHLPITGVQVEWTLRRCPKSWLILKNAFSSQKMHFWAQKTVASALQVTGSPHLNIQVCLFAPPTWPVCLLFTLLSIARKLPYSNFHFSFFPLNSGCVDLGTNLHKNIFYIFFMHIE
jgi:hypothetical protein